VPRLCEVYPGICLTTQEKACKNPSEKFKHQILTSIRIKAVTHKAVTHKAVTRKAVTHKARL